MGGQDGYSRTMLDYTSESNTVMAGVKYVKKDSMELGLDLSWMQAEAGLDPFALTAPEYEATHPPMSFDFSQTTTYSDLDSTRIDTEVWAKFWLKANVWLRLRYHYVDYQDDAPYLYDTSGTYQYAAASVGWAF
jgi:hypothetical protein